MYTLIDNLLMNLPFPHQKKKAEQDADADADEEVVVPFPDLMDIARCLEYGGVNLNQLSSVFF